MALERGRHGQNQRIGHKIIEKLSRKKKMEDETVQAYCLEVSQNGEVNLGKDEELPLLNEIISESTSQAVGWLDTKNENTVLLQAWNTCMPGEVLRGGRTHKRCACRWTPTSTRSWKHKWRWHNRGRWRSKRRRGMDEKDKSGFATFALGIM